MEYQYSIGTSQIFQVMVYKGYLQVQKHMQQASLAKVSEPKTEKRTKKGSTLSELLKKDEISCDQIFFRSEVFIWSLWQLIKLLAESYEMWHTVRGHSQH